jgi:Rho-binding antiterminator
MGPASLSEASKPQRADHYRVKPTDYKPVDCGLHSGYELLIMQRRCCTLDWRDAAGRVRIQVVTPTDLHTRNGAEFMEVTDAAGMTLEIRLDRIQHCTPA